MQIARNWRLKGPRYRLEGARDPRSGAVLFPPPVDAENWERVALAGRGVIESFATGGQTANGFAANTIMALVRLDQGPLVTAALTDVALANVVIGQRVEMVTRKLRDLGPDGLIVYGYKFRPVLEQE